MMQADREQLAATVAYTKVQTGSLVPLVAGIHQHMIRKSMSVSGERGAEVPLVAGIHQRMIRKSMSSVRGGEGGGGGGSHTGQPLA